MCGAGFRYGVSLFCRRAAVLAYGGFGNSTVDCRLHSDGNMRNLIWGRLGVIAVFGRIDGAHGPDFLSVFGQAYDQCGFQLKST